MFRVSKIFRNFVRFNNVNKVFFSNTMDMEDFDQCITNYQSGFNKDLLKDKIVFVTGGASGIGFTITEILMRHGCNSVIASRNKSKLNHSAKKLKEATGRQCIPLEMDVRKPEEVSAAVDMALANYPKIDILINAAAGNFLCTFDKMSYNAFKTVIDIDTIGTFNTSKVIYEKSMKNTGGVIINISATLYYRGNPAQAHAGSAKAAVDALTTHMAVELGPSNIRVISVAPGPISQTIGWSKLKGQIDADEFTQQIPLQRMGAKKNIADVVLFLASDMASYITGTCIVVDGGHWLTFNPFSKL